MKKYSVDKIKVYASSKIRFTGNKRLTFSNVANPDDADSNSLIFINKNYREANKILVSTKAQIILCHYSFSIPKKLLTTKCFIQVDNPKIVFIRLLNQLFYSNKIKHQVHATAVINHEAQIHNKVYIGPFTYIGKAVVEENVIIYGHCHIYDNVHIGKNSIIHAGCIIGADGFGYVKNEKQEYEKFPQIGRVIIEDNVEIGANSCIDRGALKDTVIKKGVKIDNLVHIGHNSVVGKNTMITAQVVFAGSTIVGDNCYLAPNVTTNGHLKIGHNVFVGTGSVITKDIPNNAVWVGSPARPIAQFRKIQEKIKKYE